LTGATGATLPAMQPAPDAPESLPFPEPLQVGDRWVFSFEREGGAAVERQAVIALVRPGIEVVLYVGPRRYAVPWSEVPAAFAHATRGVIRRGRVRPPDAAPPTASASFPRLPPPAPEPPPMPPPTVEPPAAIPAVEPAAEPPAPAAVEPAAPAAPSQAEGRRRGRR